MFKWALVLVDIQEEFTTIPEVHDAFPHLRVSVEGLLHTFRSQGFPIVHIRAEYNVESSPWIPWFYEISQRTYRPTLPTSISWAKELEDEKVIIKHTFDGFLGTDLESYLKEKGIERVFICGLLTSACVLATTVGAFFRGFETYLVSDCCGDRSVEKHESILKMYGNYYFRVITEAEITLLAKK